MLDSASNLLTTGSIDHHDFLARADTINAVGKMVLISNYAEYYKLAAYVQRYTKSRIGIVLGIPNLKELFDEKYYELLEGGILDLWPGGYGRARWGHPRAAS